MKERKKRGRKDGRTEEEERERVSIESKRTFKYIRLLGRSSCQTP